ncbi:MAG: transcription antitermination factor NusB [Planctomycetota bacterium]|jgi:transcription antitermination factor NusB|nr:transcription antitermination factor NusB [Planctomycetota bacterium]MDP6941114.1 transcription antitermination factor NusB [Planctomycetota bacterium]
MSVPVRRRTRARELSLQFLFMLELRGGQAMEDWDAFIKHHTQRNPDKKGREEVATYSKTLIDGVQLHLHELNTWIERIASNWRLERMAHIDRNILRIAIYELLFIQDVPFKVVINEAIDVAKRYSTAQSGSFVNGILDRARLIINEQREMGVEHPAPPMREPSLAPPTMGDEKSSMVAPPVPPTPQPRTRIPKTDPEEG